MPKPRVLFFVEGFTDIRFVTGLSEIADLTLCVPADPFRSSGLEARVAASGARLHVEEISGGRMAFQGRSMRWLWRNIRSFDVVVSQELLRGSLNATIAGAIRGVPVITTMALAPVEYFRCRRTRGQISAAKAWAGEIAIRSLMTVNGRLSTRCLALGSYLQPIARRYCTHTEAGAYYGVDTSYFKPVSPSERLGLRAACSLPADRFVVLLSSRISHEKDPETIIRATAKARERGLDALLINLSGGHKAFLDIAERLYPGSTSSWILGRDAVHPMTELAPYFQTADCVAQASFAEGLGLSTLESLACGTPVVATRVGGMATHLPGYARLSAPGNADAMAAEILWIAANPDQARAEALRGREMVEREWSRTKAFADLAAVIDDVIRAGPAIVDGRASDVSLATKG